MSGVGFLGMGKIGRALAAEVTRLGHEVAFVYDPFLKEPGELPQVTSLDDPRCAKASLVVECATADALKQGFDQIIAHSNLLVFSLTAFSDADLPPMPRRKPSAWAGTSTSPMAPFWDLTASGTDGSC